MVGMMNAALERLYTGKCTVTVREDYLDGSVTRQRTKELYRDLPCRLSYRSSRGSDAVAGGQVTGALEQVTSLFLAPETDIPPGSELAVTQNGVTVVYTHSGQPRLYASHQEIGLELKKEKP